MSDEATSSAAVLRETFQSAPTPLVLVRVETDCIVGCTSRAATLFDAEQSDVTGTAPDEWWDENPTGPSVVEAAASADTTVTRRAKPRPADGDRQYELEAKPVTAGNAKHCVVRVDPDPTPLTEDVVPARQFDALFEAPASFVGLLHPDGTVRRINQDALSFADATLDRVVGQKFWETPFWSHSEELREDLQTWIERAASGTPVRYEADHHGHRGDAVTVDGVLQPVTDDDGTVTGILAIGRDITARKRLQETLERREESLRRLHEALSDSDPSFEEKIGEILAIACDRLGVEFGFLTSIDDGAQTIEAARGSHPPVTPGDTSPLSEGYCRKTVERDDPLAVREISGEEWEGDPARDRFDWGCYIGSKVTVDGELYGTLCFSDPDPRERQFTDDERTYVELLTQWVSFELERVRYQRDLQRQNERLEEFASAHSHDLRNPLTAAAGYLDLARSAEDPEQHLDDVEVMHDRMAELVDDVLAVARNGGDVDPADMDDVSLANVAAKAWATANTGDATLRTGAADVVLRCDEGRLRQLLENLFRNAVQHGAAESGQSADGENDRGDDVTVRVAATDDGFVVADDGAGIPPEVRDDVFERGFSTSDDSTGFGLTIVREIAEAHGWTVSVGESGPAVSDGRDESEPSGDDLSGGARFAFGNVEFA